MRIDQSKVILYEKSRSLQFVKALQKEHSVVEPFAHFMPSNNGEYVQLPAIGSTSINYRTDRIQDIVAEELKYGYRNMRPILFEKFLSKATDDSLFMGNLADSLSDYTEELAKATMRKKDEVLMGTVEDAGENSPTKGQYVIKTPTTIYNNAEDGSPYKGGATGGLLGDNYVGKAALDKEPLPLQPYIEGKGLLSDYLKYTESTALDFKRTNVIPHTFVQTGTPVESGFTVEKFIAGYQCLEARYAASRTTEVCMAITYKQAFEMMTNEKFQNQLYGWQALKTGFVDNVMGVRFLICDTLPLVNVGTSSAAKWVRACPMWTKETLCYGVWQKAEFHIRQPEEKIGQVLIGVTFGLGAARKREESVVCIMCDEGFTPAA